MLKKGDSLDCANYRGVCLLNVVLKVFANNQQNRLLLCTNQLFSIFNWIVYLGKLTIDQRFALEKYPNTKFL
jgi:hypothetical protein